MASAQLRCKSGDFGDEDELTRKQTNADRWLCFVWRKRVLGGRGAVDDDGDNGAALCALSGD